MIGDVKALNVVVKAVQDCGQGKLSVGTGNFHDICEDLFAWFCDGKVLCNQIFGLQCSMICSGNPIGTTFGSDSQIVLQQIL